MPDTDIVIRRIAEDAVRVHPMAVGGTAVFMIDLAREIGGTMEEVNCRKVLVKAKSVAENFIDRVNREVHGPKVLKARSAVRA
jgi:hypothetical protein